MEINRNNYELWLIDLRDGNLAPEEESAVMIFLDNNPDIKAEFGETADISLTSGLSQYENSDFLKKDPCDLSDEQVEYYIIANLENDLSPEQAAEVNELTGSDKRFSSLNSIHHSLKLSPPDIHYPGKLHLLRIPYRKRRKIMVRSAMALAASLLVFVSSYTFLHHNGTPATQDSFQVVADMKIFVEPQPAGTEGLKNLLLSMKPERRDPVVKKISYEEAGTARAEEVTPVASTERPEIALEPARPVNGLNMPAVEPARMMAEMVVNKTGYDAGAEDIGDISPRKIIARNFRELVLKEANPGSENLRVYEIADGGIRGLNHLLGWDMKLETGVGEDGKLNQIKFSSQLINIDRKLKNKPE